MLQPRSDKPSGLSANMLKTWGYLFLLMGIAGQSIIQNKILGLGSVTTGQLLEAMTNDSNVMVFATLALVCQAVSTCATPIFAFLLVEGYCHTSDLKKYLTRVAAMALGSEIPYNLAMSGKILDFSSRNPALGLVLALLMLVLFNQYQEKKPVNYLIKIGIAVAAVLWAKMLSIADASCLVLMTVTFWLMRNRPNFRSMAGCAAAGLCSVFSLFYIASPMSVFAVHAYNGEKGNQNRAFNYLFYPVALLACGIAVLFL